MSSTIVGYTLTHEVSCYLTHNALTWSRRNECDCLGQTVLDYVLVILYNHIKPVPSGLVVTYRHLIAN